MIYTMNLAWLDEEFERFGSVEALRTYLDRFGLSGIEYLSFDEEVPRYPTDLIRGVHLHIPESWIDMWKENREGILDEYITIETAEMYFGKNMHQGMIDDLKAQLEFAKRANAEYVVFHVSEIKLKEAASWNYAYSREEVIRSAAQWINAALAGMDVDFYFLMENLWWNGFTMTDPKLTKLMLDNVHYEKKGIMLDLGHLLHTNLDLKDEVEGLDYIYQCLKEHGDLCRYIKGIHLHQSITGNEMRTLHATHFDWADNYYDRTGQVLEHIFKIDKHQPYACEGIRELLDYIDPAYVTLEFISHNQEEHEQMLTEQMKWL